MRQLTRGFSLIEVLVALMMFSITMTSLLTLQNTLQRIIFTDTRQWQAEQLALQALVEAEKQQQAALGKVVERQQDDFTIEYTISRPTEGSALAEIEQLVIEKVVVSWATSMAQEHVTLVKYSYRPAEKKDTAPTVGVSA